MTKTTIATGRDYVDERLCGVNDMTFEEWLSYQDQCLGTIALINTIVDRTKKNTIHWKMNHQTKTNHRTNHRKKTMNRTTIMTTVFVCAIQPILEQAITVVTPEARISMVNVAQTDTTGGSRHDHRIFIVT